MPATLTENLFNDKVNDARLLKGPVFLQQVVCGHVERITKAFGLKRKGRTVNKPVASKPSKPVNKQIRSRQVILNVL